MKKLLALLAFALLAAAPAHAVTPTETPSGNRIKHTLPAAVIEAVGTKGGAPLARVGETTYSKLFFTIYHATLWAPNGKYDPKKPYALQIQYARDIDRDTLVDSVASDVNAHEQPDEATMVAWRDNLHQVLPDVLEGEELIGVYIPGQNASLYFNGKRYSTMKDKRLAKAFFGVWLSDKADPDIRAALTNTPAQ